MRADWAWTTDHGPTIRGLRTGAGAAAAVRVGAVPTPRISTSEHLTSVAADVEMHLLAACSHTLYAVIITIAAEVVVHEHDALTGNQQWRFCFFTLNIIILVFGLLGIILVGNRRSQTSSRS